MRKDERADHPWTAWVLAWVAGAVDAIGFVVLAHLFTAHMTGNTVGMSVGLATADWNEALRRAIPLPFFVLGGVAGAVIAELAMHRGLRRVLTLALLAEAALMVALGVVRACWSSFAPLTPQFWLLAAVAATAMGLQNAVFRHVGHPSLNTTVVTGALSALAEHTVVAVMRTREGRQAPEWRRAGLSGGLWLGYALGGLAGASAETFTGRLSPLVPLCGLVVAIAMAWRHEA